MDKEIADKWVAALRSGKYKQGKKALCKVEGKNVKYCCLGVLCHILGTPYTKKDKRKYYGTPETGIDTGVLPYGVRLKTGIKTCNGSFDQFENDSLISLNDHGKSFKEIANIIEKNWEKL